MRIWQIHELGEPIERLQIDEVVDPTPGPGEVTVAVEAVGLMFPNVLMCRGEYQMPTVLPYSPGGEVAGRVVEIGDGVEGVETGQLVVAQGGALAERVVLRAGSVFAVPDGVSAVKAAAIPVNYGTTWFALHDRGHIQAGETLLVSGAAGSTGSAAIQLGLAAGAKVIALAGGAEKVALCEALGAHHVIDYHEVPDFVDRVRELTDGAGVDVAYDPVGGEVFGRIRRCMAWDGRLLVIGFVAGIPDAPVNHILLKNYSVVGVHWGASLARDPSSLVRQMDAVMSLAVSGEVDPPIDGPHPFAGAAELLQALADRKVIGKAIVDVTA